MQGAGDHRAGKSQGAAGLVSCTHLTPPSAAAWAVCGPASFSASVSHLLARAIDFSGVMACADPVLKGY